MRSLHRVALIALIPFGMCVTSCGDDGSSSPPIGQVHQDASPDSAKGDAAADVATDHVVKESGVDGAAGSPADSGVDAHKEAAADAAPDAEVPKSPAVYPTDRTHSPITPWVVDRLGEVLGHAPSSRRDLFMKVGDSISASNSFLDCFADSGVDLGSHQALQPTLDLYKGATVQGTTPFDRTSLCVEVGRTAYWAMSGTPSPLEKEIDATQAALAVAMYGSNDIGWFGADHEATLTWYYDHMFDLVDALIAAGTIPILSTIPPRDDDASLDAWVPMLNAVVRGMAQGRQIPLVDFHRELMPLAKHGLSGDKLHPASFSGGACKLTAAGLEFGYNVRNLVTLEALDRVRRAALSTEGALDSTAPSLAGEGTAASPFLITGSLFTDLRDSSQSKSRTIDTYAGCSSAANEGGGEYFYRLEVTKASRVRAMVFDRGNVDIDLHLLGGDATGAGCIARADSLVQSDLAPGTYHFSLDTFVSGGTERAGEYLFVMLLCDPGDPACQ